MTPRTTSLYTTALCGVVLLASAPSASAFWRNTGSGAGLRTTATMPTAVAPSGAVAGTSVDVSWPQSSFFGVRLGTYGGGGDTIRRYAGGGSSPVVPGAGCSTVVSGARATLGCVEQCVPYGSGRYSVTPMLGTFTGGESPASVRVDVATAAPVLSAATVQTTGDVQLSWATVVGATGYDVFRRAAGGAFEFGAPLNGETPIALDATYTDRAPVWPARRATPTSSGRSQALPGSRRPAATSGLSPRSADRPRPPASPRRRR